MSIYDTLNDKQKEAVETTEGPLLILAGAGSGKTRVLTHRVAWLIDELGVNPWNIMAITFTNKAAGEMRERVDNLVGYGAESIWVATFHASCVRILRRYSDRLGYDHNFTIYDTDDQKTVIRDICKRLQIDTKQLKERTILNAISNAKNELISEDAFMAHSAGDYYDEKIAACYVEYQKALKKSNAFDFDDLIMKCVELLRNHEDVLEGYQRRFRYIMVDEYQDTNTAQFELIRLLAGGYRNLCVVGDDDQSIYKFRGANIRNILDFEKVYPEAKVIKLEQNYRSCGRILDAANAVIRHNRGRKDKALWTDRGEGEKIHFLQFDQAYDEADYIIKDIRKQVQEKGLSYDNFAILYRTNAQARLLEERCVFMGIPYQVVGGTNFYARKEIKDVLAYLKTIDNGRDDVAVKRIINIPKRGIGATTIAKVQGYAQENDMTFFEALEQEEWIASLGKTGAKLQAFVTLIQSFRTKAKEYGLGRLLEDMLELINYREYLEETEEEDAEDRMDNVDELLNKLIDYEDTAEEPTLSGFLEEVALVAEIDTVDDNSKKLLLMTLHGAKGLEFEHVYLAGMEDGVFPSYMTIVGDDPSELEEERRLAYVGITRAMDVLTITCARQRMLHGQTQYNMVSRFVREIPEELLDRKLPGKSHPEWEEASFKKAPVRAVLKPKTTQADAKPYLLRSAQSLQQPAVSPTKEGADKLPYGVGDQVKHIKFGQGVVVSIEPGSRDYQVTVNFEQFGNKIMYAGFAKLEKIKQ